MRLTKDETPGARIEAAAGGVAYEQVRALKAAYVEMRDRAMKDTELPKIELSLSPVDDITWNASGVKNHGVLMLAQKGVILRLPSILTSSRYKEFYRELLVNWVRKALEIARNSKANFPEVEIKRMTYGRIESTPSRGKTRGLVIAAPHGSFDWYTSELVEELSDRTSLAAVVTRGFTPTECGGWRINVNRPTERRYPTDTVECKTDRAIEVFHDYTESVFHAARGHLDLYIEMHQNGIENHIDVATLGLTRQQAIAIKQAYQAIRDRVLRETTGVSAVNLAIEPVDTVAIGARVAKDQGTLRLAKKSLHFEFPAQLVFDRNRARRAYTRILAELIDDIVKLQGNPTADRSASFKLPNRDAK